MCDNTILCIINKRIGNKNMLLKWFFFYCKTFSIFFLFYFWNYWNEIHYGSLTCLTCPREIIIFGKIKTIYYFGCFCQFELNLSSSLTTIMWAFCAAFTFIHSFGYIDFFFEMEDTKKNTIFSLLYFITSFFFKSTWNII
jgi:hypothetical protein